MCGGFVDAGGPASITQKKSKRAKKKRWNRGATGSAEKQIEPGCKDELCIEEAFALSRVNWAAGARGLLD
jgi:hypothetical protein